MSDEVSAEEAQRVIDDVAHARAGGLMSAGGEHAALTMELLADAGGFVLSSGGGVWVREHQIAGHA